jgi:hypothetical protein
MHGGEKYSVCIIVNDGDSPQMRLESPTIQIRSGVEVSIAFAMWYCDTDTQWRVNSTQPIGRLRVYSCVKQSMYKH